MKKRLCFGLLALLVPAIAAYGQQASSATVEGKSISVKATPIAARNRAAGSFHTDADLVFVGFNVPKGDYTMYVLAEGNQWQLAVNSATGAKAVNLRFEAGLGRVPMNMTKAAAPSPAAKITVKQIAAMAAAIEVTWNDSTATANFHLDRGPNDAEW